MNREVLTIDYKKVVGFVDHQIYLLESEEEDMIQRGLQLIIDGHKPDEILGEISAKIEEWKYLKLILEESPEVFT